MASYEEKEKMTLKISYMIGIYYKNIREFNSFSQGQILFASIILILMPYYNSINILIAEVKKWFDMSPEGIFEFSGREYEIYSELEQFGFKGDEFFLAICVQVITKFLYKIEMEKSILFFNYILDKETRKAIFNKISEGLLGLENEFGLMEETVIETIYEFFRIKELAEEISNFIVSESVERSISRIIKYKKTNMKQ